MSTVEDRLTAALEARAELVRTEDLRYVEPPSAPSRLPRLAAYTVAAAACGAAVAAPFVLGGGPGDEATDPPPATQQPTSMPAPNGDDVPGAGWTEAYSYPRAFDVDGDGAPDEVMVRTEGAEFLPPGARRVEAHLTTGGVAAVLLDYETYDLTVVEPVELDGEAGDEILYYRGTETQEMGVLALRDGALVDLAVPDDPGITSQLDERGRLRTRWVEGGELYSSRSVEGGFELGDGTKRIPAEYPVDVWSWDLVDGELRATALERQCVRTPGSDRPVPCS